MSDIQRRYTSISGLDALDHRAEAERTARHFREVLLPALAAGGLTLESAKVVEFGAGWGRNLLALRALGARSVRGQDASAEQVALAHRLGLPELVAVEADAAPLASEADASVDLLLAVDVLEHLALPGLEAFAAAARRVLRPGGLLVVQVPNALAPLNPVPAGDVTHRLQFNALSVLQVLRLAGVEPVTLRGVGFAGGGLGNRIRRALSAALVAPLLRGMARIQYGAREEPWIVEPNLLAVGRKPVP